MTVPADTFTTELGAAPPLAAGTNDVAAAVAELRGVLRRWVRNRAAGAARACAEAEHPAATLRWWDELADLGALGAHLPEWAGGGGAGLAGAVAVLTELATGLVPGPVLPTVLAGHLLATAAGDGDLVGETLATLASGTRAAVAVARDLIRDGAGRITADLGPVVGLPDADVMLVATELDGTPITLLLDPSDPAVRVEPEAPLDLTRSVGRGRLVGLAPDPARVLPGLDARTLADATAGGVVAEAAGLAAWCLDTAVAHARTRVQFGRPIGAFQAVNHACVDLLVARDRTDALAAAVAGGDSRAVAAAGTLAPEAAVAAAKGCVQLLGGAGFAWEHDAHLWLRRALADRQLAGPAGTWARRALDSFRADPVDLDVVRAVPGPELRAEAARIAASPPSGQRRVLADSGLLAPALPRPYGRGAGPVEQAAVRTALRDAGVNVPDLVVGTWALATIAAAGTPEQCARFVPPTLRGDLAWCQLFSEPEAGSDLASLRTRAEPVSHGWAVTGHKIWTSRAADADWGICLARVPEGGERSGVTFFLVPMRDERVRVRPIRTMTGQPRFAEVFLEGVVVPPEQVVGAVGDGWRVARTTLGSERVQMSNTRFGTDLQEITATLDELPPAERIDAESTVGALVAEGIALQAMTAQGLIGGQSGEVRKLVAMSYYQRTSELAYELLGSGGLVASTAANQLLETRGLTIGGGTSEVLKTAIGERVLGLPRGRVRG